MIKKLDCAQNSTSFLAKKPDKKSKADEETHILPNTMKTRLHQGFQKTSSAFIDYPVKGLKGDINSDFYEFLTMGIVPYIVGSAMFMFVFNCVNKHLDAHSQRAASQYGKKMALGVVLYGVMKNLSKNLVTKPIKAATGVDTEMPYQNKVYPLPKEAGQAATIEPQYQQRKVFDSKEFYRKDLLDRVYFDSVAKKLGLGDNLNDSITETSPIIQNIVATSNTAKSLSSYCWAGVGVALAMQDCWNSFFDVVSDRRRYVSNKNENLATKFVGKTKNFAQNSLNISKEFVKTFGRAWKSLWKGNPANSGFMRHSGKAFIGFASLVTALLTFNSITRAKSMAQSKNKVTIDKSKESTVI